MKLFSELWSLLDGRARSEAGAILKLMRFGRPAQEGAARSADTWNTEYTGGRWAYLGELSELSRYSVLTGYMAYLKPGGSVLDVGCGTGVLYQRVRPHGYSRYVGVDLSSSAVASLAAAGDARSEFLAADGELYQPAGSFDIIVFNEVLYFFRDPEAAVARYARSLAAGGILLISTCTGFRGGLALLDRVKSAYTLIDETRLTHGANAWSWVVTVLAPRG